MSKERQRRASAYAQGKKDARDWMCVMYRKEYRYFAEYMAGFRQVRNRQRAKIGEQHAEALKCSKP